VAIPVVAALLDSLDAPALPHRIFMVQPALGMEETGVGARHGWRRDSNQHQCQNQG